MSIDFSFLLSIAFYAATVFRCDKIIVEYKEKNTYSNTYLVTYYDGKNIIAKRLVDIF